MSLSAARACRLYSPAVYGSSGIRHVDQVMRNALALFRRRLGRSQLHAAIHSDGVTTDNLAVEFFCQLERQRRLPAAGRPQNNHHQRIHARISPPRNCRVRSNSAPWRLTPRLWAAKPRIGVRAGLQRRHQPLGKIQAGFVCQSHHPRIATASNTSPIASFRRAIRVCSALRASSSRSMRYGLITRSTKSLNPVKRCVWTKHQYRRMPLPACHRRLTSTGRFAQIALSTPSRHPIRSEQAGHR